MFDYEPVTMGYLTYLNVPLLLQKRHTAASFCARLLVFFDRPMAAADARHEAVHLRREHPAIYAEHLQTGKVSKVEGASKDATACEL
jgi:hypothetical protein